MKKAKKKSKTNSVKKASVIVDMEKKKRGTIKIGFDEEKSPIRNIKTKKISPHKPQEREKIKVDSEITEIEDLEREIKAKKKLLKLKKEEEKQKEIERKKLEEAENQQEVIPKKDIQKIRLLPFIDNKRLKICPICNSKISASKIRKVGFALSQSFKCKNKACNFTKEISFNI